MVALLAAGCTSAPTSLSRPNRVALGPRGEVYVSDFQHDRVVEFDPNGAFVRTFGRQGLGLDEIWRVTAMTVAPDGTLVLVNRRPRSADDASDDLYFELKRFRDGHEVGVVRLDQRVVTKDAWIDSLAPARDGNWLLAESTEGELVLVDAQGLRVGRFGGVPRFPDWAPTHVRPDGDVFWVVEQSRHRISRMREGGVEELVILQDDGHRPPSFPAALGVCPGRWFAVADLGNHRVERYAPDGRRIGGFVPEPAGPDRPVQLLDLQVTADCARLYLVDSKGDRVLVTDPEGTVLQTLAAWDG